MPISCLLHRRLQLVSAFCLGLVALLSGARSASACALVVGADGKAQIAGERVIVNWNPDDHLEHLVRQLDVQTSSRFGFLVPTPSRPQLAEADEEVFDRMYGLYRIHDVKRMHQSITEFSSLTVVDQQHVAGLDATVLAASDAKALAAWLGQHGFQATPGLERYLKPYVQPGWFVTAFVFTPSPSEPRFTSSALRLTFHTDRPFFPYAEPDDAPVSETRRAFRLVLVSPQRMEGRRGSAPWIRASFADALERSAVVTALTDAIPRDDIAARGQFRAADGKPWVTVFDERHSKRGAEDLYFQDDSVQKPSPSSIDWP